MKYISYGSTDMKVSRICFGGGHLADFGMYGTSRAEAVDAVRFALEQGINFFDTSEWYGHGEGERLLGEALGQDRNNVYVATKAGLHLHGNVGIRDSRPERIIRHIDQALQRLHTDYVDLFQIHWPDPFVPFEASWEAMCEVRKSGKARYIGVSNYRTNEMAASRKAGEVHSLQSCFHMFRRDIERDQLAYCREHRMGVMVWGPLAHGLLTGKFSTAHPPDWPAGDWRLDMPIMKGDGLRSCMQTIDRLLSFCRERNKSLIDLAIAWTLSIPGISTVITGSRKRSHLQSQLGGVEWELTREELSEIEAILAAAPSWSALGGDEEYGGHHVIPVSERGRIGAE